MAAGFFTVGWLILARTLQKYGVTPEEIGASFTWLAVRAGLAAGILLAAMGALSYVLTKYNTSDFAIFVVGVLLLIGAPLLLTLTYRSEDPGAWSYVLLGLQAGTAGLILFVVFDRSLWSGRDRLMYIPGCVVFLICSLMVLLLGTATPWYWILVLAGAYLIGVTIVPDLWPSFGAGHEEGAENPEGAADNPEGAPTLPSRILTPRGAVIVLGVTITVVAIVALAVLPVNIQRRIERGAPIKGPLGLLTFDRVHLSDAPKECLIHLGDNGGIIVLMNPITDRAHREPADATRLRGGC